MSFIDRVLQVPSYGWENQKGELIVPTKKQLWNELFSRINFIKDKKNWLNFTGWFWVLCLLPFPLILIFNYLTPALFLLVVVYSMAIMGTHGTIWYHRYCTHKSFKFSHPIWRFITQNLVVKVVPEEIYVVSHHVHHTKSDMPGDPYNAKGGFLYCYLADTNHQPIATDLSVEEYDRVKKFLNHTGIRMNSYKQYQKWGTVAHPFYTACLWVFNWSFWYTAFYFIGGHALACTIFSSALVWVVGVRTFNYAGHGKGEDKRQEGVDFNWKDMSINQTRPGLLAGEWHNNHHLFPGSARSGFLKYQLDLAWCYIYFLYKIGAVSSYVDSKKEFLDKYYTPKVKEVELDLVS